MTDRKIAPGAVLVRSPDPELQLQGLRTALSLAMGDRPAAVFVAAEAGAVLQASPDTETGQCLAALPEAGVSMLAERGDGIELPQGVRGVSRARMLSALGEADFQQNF